MHLIIIPYIANILILLPVCLGALFNIFPVSKNHFPESSGWRTLTGSLWSGILVSSIAGCVYPYTFSPILFLQVIYKSIWLLTYVAPRLLKAESRKEIHWEMTTCFVLIVLLYPWVIPWNHLFPAI